VSGGGAEAPYKEKTMRIKNNSGEFWTGEGWGVEQVAAVYESLDDLPLFLDDLEREVFAFDHSDIRYYDGESAIEAEASVV